MSGPLTLRFVTSAPEVADLPDTRAEVAVVGRSNVGKSSLLNAVTGTKGLAKVSQRPGKTQLLNCFATEHGTTVVDLPGYGYAKTSAQNRAAWERRMQRYLRRREGLALTLLLVDGEIGPTRLDEQMLAWLREHAVPFRVVATKHDKVRSSQRERRKRDLAAGCDLPPGEILWVSAERGVGIDRLRNLLLQILTPG